MRGSFERSGTHLEEARHGYVKPALDTWIYPPGAPMPLMFLGAYNVSGDTPCQSAAQKAAG